MKKARNSFFYIGGGISLVMTLLILMGYMIFCAFVPDVRRTFQYHGAEHKTVYNHEADLPLTPENADKYTTLHPRCGTSFLLIVFVISILLFTVVGYNGDVFLWRFLSHLALLPVVAGVSYEALKGLAHSESRLAHALRWPGMQMQRLTTRKPDNGMPEKAPRTPEGYAVLHSYRESEPGYAWPQESEQA